MTTTTRKQLIIQQYTLLRNDLINTGLIKEDLFPSLDDIDVGDLIFFFQFSFPDSNKYEKSISDLLEEHDVKLKPKEKKVLINIILPFLLFFQNIT